MDDLVRSFDGDDHPHGELGRMSLYVANKRRNEGHACLVLHDPETQEVLVTKGFLVAESEEEKDLYPGGSFIYDASGMEIWENNYYEEFVQIKYEIIWG